MGANDVTKNILLDNAPTEDEILEDISRAKQAALDELSACEIDYPIYLPSDITGSDIRKQRNVTNRSAVDYMIGVAKRHPDKWQCIKVVKVAGNRNAFWVLRKV